MAEKYQLQRRAPERTMPKQRIAIDQTWVNKNTGESETWHDVGANGENIPVAKTLPEVTVTAKRKPKARPVQAGTTGIPRTVEPPMDGMTGEAVQATPEERRRWREEVEMHDLGPLERPVREQPHIERIVDHIEYQPSDEEIMRRREELRRYGPALEKYGDDYQDIWQRGNRRKVER